jgi:pyridoxamine 5'-phosphate oxidase
VSCLDINKFNKCPIEQFNNWFLDAYNSGEVMPNAMAVSTVGDNFAPSSRIVLLKAYDSKGFIFFADKSSRKIKEASINNNVSLLFYWATLERQIRIEGRLEVVDNLEALKYFVNRFGKGIGFWVEDKTKTLKIRKILENSLENYLKKPSIKDIQVWFAYRVKPSYFEFWQGCEDVLYEKIMYEKKQSNWLIKKQNGLV